MKVKKLLKYSNRLFYILFPLYLSSEPLYLSTALSTCPSLTHFPKYIAHKALTSENFKGNPKEAIQEALISYVEGIEVEVQFSKDHIPFLYHGQTLEEETTGRGKPEDYEWTTLERLTYKDSSPSSLMGLEDLLTLIGSQKFLDIKMDKILNSTLPSELARLIYTYHLEETVFIKSFNPFFLISMRLKGHDILLMYNFPAEIQVTRKEIQEYFNKIPWILKQSFFQKK